MDRIQDKWTQNWRIASATQAGLRGELQDAHGQVVAEGGVASALPRTTAMQLLAEAHEYRTRRT